MACHLMPALNLTNSILNNMVFLVLSLAIDILMIRFTNKNLERKLRVSHDPKHINEALELKKNIIKMILTNAGTALMGTGKAKGAVRSGFNSA
jgi:hypothetical protein